MTSCPWDGFDPGTVAFCERRLCAWIVEPSNAWSNIAYLLVGLAILWHRRSRLSSALAMVGYTAVIVSLGSFAFHATGTFIGEVLDVSAMYLISGLFITFAVKRYYGWSDPRLIRLYGALSAVSIALLIATRVSGIPVFALQVTVAVLIEIVLFRRFRQAPDASVSYKPMLALILLFSVSFLAWWLDISHRVCDPDNHVFTGHAFWHVSNSLCLWFFYAFHRQFEART